MCGVNRYLRTGENPPGGAVLNSRLSTDGISPLIETRMMVRCRVLESEMVQESGWYRGISIRPY